MELDRRGAELLFQVLTEREETNSVAIASNESFSGWTKTFTDPRLCAAIVDRLTFGGNIIETGTVSYRLAHARAHRAGSTGTGRARRPQSQPGMFQRGLSAGSVLLVELLARKRRKALGATVNATIAASKTTPKKAPTTTAPVRSARAANSRSIAMAPDETASMMPPPSTARFQTGQASTRLA